MSGPATEYSPQRAAVRIFLQKPLLVHSTEPSGFGRWSTASASGSSARAHPCGRGGGVVIAPADWGAFLSDIARRAPQLTRRGQDLVLAYI